LFAQSPRYANARKAGKSAGYITHSIHNAIRRTREEQKNKRPRDHAAPGANEKRDNGARGAGAQQAEEKRPHAGPGPAPAPQAEPWPAPLEDAAYHGPLGDLAGLVAPETEADPVAVLAALLVGTGAVIGGTPYALVNDTRHPTVLYAALVGRSAMARKGTARDHALAALGEIDYDWTQRRCISGLSSGEGLIYEVRDPRPARNEKDEGDPGELDKRLLVVENELARTLRAGCRKDSTLPYIITDITDAFDGKPLATRVLKNPLRAATHHICIVGMITRAALARELSTVDMASGFANRFLWLMVKRSATLPEGGRPLLDIPGVPEIVTRLDKAVSAARRCGRMARDDAARALWADEYTHTLSVERPGLLGDVTNRADALTLRLSMVYALADESDRIREAHVRAALAVVGYSLRSCAILFGGRTGSTIADRLLQALQDAGRDGLSQTDIYAGLFGRNMPASEIATALRLLEETGRAYPVKGPTGPQGGRPEMRWFVRDAGGL
jgi:hypothetical protein